MYLRTAAYFWLTFFNFEQKKGICKRSQFIKTVTPCKPYCFSQIPWTHSGLHVLPLFPTHTFRWYSSSLLVFALVPKLLPVACYLFCLSSDWFITLFECGWPDVNTMTLLLQSTEITHKKSTSYQLKALRACGSCTHSQLSWCSSVPGMRIPSKL